jgi:uncharacterized membrane protein YccF (DUF307 family)
VAAIGLAVAAVAILKKNWAGDLAEGKQAWIELKNGVSTAIAGIKGAVSSVANIGKNIVSGLWEGISSMGARPLKLPFVTGIGPFSIAAMAVPPGNSSLMVLLMNKSSGRNAYQAIASSTAATPRNILRFLMKGILLCLVKLLSETLGSG